MFPIIVIRLLLDSVMIPSKEHLILLGKQSGQPGMILAIPDLIPNEKMIFVVATSRICIYFICLVFTLLYDNKPDKDWVALLLLCLLFKSLT